jgi:acetyl esterase/lipase
VNPLKLILTSVVLLAAHGASAQQALPLYERAIPNALPAADEETLRDPKDPYPFYQDISRPQLFAFPLAAASTPHAAIVILPGGSYRGVSIVKEGFDVAKQLNAYGVAAFVVKYRTPSDKHMRDKTTGPLQDAQRALQVVHERAREWNVDPARIGLMGFSAGGHLASTAATHFAEPVLQGVTAAQARPAFLVLGYPVISFDDAIAHKGSREMLLGANPTREQMRKYSGELNVTAQTPPTFVFHAADDRTVPVANSLRFFEALHTAGVPSELIVFPAGGHGFGLNNSTTPDRWIERLRDWLLSRRYLRADEYARAQAKQAE